MSADATVWAAVIGVGNPDRGDDGVAAAVIERLRGRVPPGVRLVHNRGNPLRLFDDWAGLGRAIIIDAAAMHAPPGQVCRIDLCGARLPVGRLPGSSHGIGLAEAIELARGFGSLPRRCIAYLVSAEACDIGARLSPAVAAAVDEVAERILSELSAWHADAAKIV
jgi:hydrogenase maturation protease